MAGPPKKRAVMDNEHSSSGSGSGSESEPTSEPDDINLPIEEEILVNFEGRTPEAQDFHGIKQLLQQLFLKAHVDLSQLSDMLIAQKNVGSVLKQSYFDDEDEDDMEANDVLDVFGITSLIDVTSNKETLCIQQLLNLIEELTKQHADDENKDEILKIIKSSRKLGLLFNERFLNIPAKISDPLLTTLLGEIERYAKKDPAYNFDYYIMIVKVNRQKENPDEMYYLNAEEEFFADQAKYFFEFSVVDEADTSLGGCWTESDVLLVPYRRVVLIEAAKLSAIVQQVKSYTA